MATLAAANLQGSEFSLEEAYRTYASKIRRTLYAVTGDVDTASDLTNECFLRAYRMRHSFRGDSLLTTWLTRIAINLGRDHRKSQMRRNLREAGSIDEHTDRVSVLADRRPDPERTLLAWERKERAKTALGELSPEQIQILNMRIKEELSFDEIAEILGMNSATVRSRYSRAIAQVRAQLAAAS